MLERLSGSLIQMQNDTLDFDKTMLIVDLDIRYDIILQYIVLFASSTLVATQQRVTFHKESWKLERNTQ